MIHTKKGGAGTTRRRRDSRGFTIIEVSLFLAVSGLLLLIVMYGISSNNKKIEFRDSMQGIADFLNGQVNAVQSGVNDRQDLSCTVSGNTINISVEGPSDNTPPGQAGECIFLGRVFYFDKSLRYGVLRGDGTGIYGKDIVGLRDPVSGVCGGVPDTQKLATHYMGYIDSSFAKHCPQIAHPGGSFLSPIPGETTPSYTYRWNTKLLNNYGRSTIPDKPGDYYEDPIFDDQKDYYKARAFGVFRDPDSGNMFTAILYGTSGNSTLAPDVSTQLCFKGLADYYGAIYVGTRFSSDSVNTISNTTSVVSLKIDDPSCGNWVEGNITDPNL